MCKGTLFAMINCNLMRYFSYFCISSTMPAYTYAQQLSNFVSLYHADLSVSRTY